MHYFPIEPLLLAIFALAIVALAILIPLGALSFVYERLGLRPAQALLVLLSTLLGSYINIPLFQLSAQRVVADRAFRYFGSRYMLPQTVDWPGTIVAINVGGAVIPIVLSLYLMAARGLWLRGLAATAIVAAFCHQMATPVPGSGIAIPVFAPPLIAAVVACLVSWRNAAPLAYIGGSLGALIGADLLNLGIVQKLGAPIASIGGAGTFDGVFLTGVLAVLLASLVGGPASKSARA